MAEFFEFLLSYETLRVIWWLLLGLLLIGFISEPRWRNTWDWCLFIGSAVPGVVFGVAMGNLLLGVPFVIDPEWLSVAYEGSFFGLLNPFGLLAGLVSIAMLVMHGAIYLQLRTEGEIQVRAQRWVTRAGLVLMGGFALAGIAVAFFIDGYVLVQFAGTEGPSNPLAKEVTREAGAWLDNYSTHSWTLLAPLAAFAGTGLTLCCPRDSGRGLGLSPAPSPSPALS